MVDSLVAVDGAYALFPGGSAQSDPAQREAIESAAVKAGMTCRVHVPDHVWRENEVEKRAFLFRLALEGATVERDWFLIVDGDQVVERMDAKAVRSELAKGVEFDTAEIMSRTQVDPATTVPHRGLFRAVPGLTVQHAHYNYVAVRDGQLRHLWHPPPSFMRRGARPAPALPTTRQHITIRHRAEPRPPERMVRRKNYYITRDRAKIERS